MVLPAVPRCRERCAVRCTRDADPRQHPVRRPSAPRRVQGVHELAPRRRRGDGARARRAETAPSGSSSTSRPMSDGGADFVESMLAGRGATIGARARPARGSGGRPVRHRRRRAILQLSAAAGMHLGRDRRDPTRTTTFGVGQLLLAAIDRGATDITIGVGNSATVDGGAGALAALGVRFFDERDAPIERPVGGDLVRVARVDPSGLDPRLARTRITVARCGQPAARPRRRRPDLRAAEGATPGAGRAAGARAGELRAAPARRRLRASPR